MMRFVHFVALLSWFAGGILLGLIEVIALPSDPGYSTILQLLPLFFLAGGIWFIIREFQSVVGKSNQSSRRVRRVMSVGWVAVFGINAGVASINNMSFQIFHYQLPYYYQGISLAQKLIALAGIFVLGGASILAARHPFEATMTGRLNASSGFWEKPATNIGFTSLLLGVVLGLGLYWPSVVFAGFILLLTGLFLYPIGRLTEKETPTFG
jgi:hypothetical protein